MNRFNVNLFMPRRDGEPCFDRLSAHLLGAESGGQRFDLFLGERLFGLPVLEEQPQKSSVDQKQGDLDVEDGRDNLPLGIVGEQEVETFKGRECGLGDGGIVLERRENNCQQQIYAYDPEQTALSAADALHGPGWPIPQQQPGDAGVDEDHEYFQGEEILVEHQIWRDFEGQVKASESGNVASLHGNEIVGRKQHHQRQVGGSEGQGNPLLSVHWPMGVTWKGARVMGFSGIGNLPRVAESGPTCTLVTENSQVMSSIVVKFIRVVPVVALAFVLLAPVAEAQEIVLRHALEGRARDALTDQVLRFNAAQKGKGKVVLQGLAGLENRRELPQLALFQPDDALGFFTTLPRYRSVYQVMAEARQPLSAKSFYSQIADAVDDSAGRIQALPLGLSLPVLFWNKDSFRKAGLDPETPPKTWWEVQKAAGALFDSGSSCPYTTSRFSWVHVENLTSQHNEALMAKPDRSLLNGLVNVKHLALLSSWYKSFYFRYYGSHNEGDERFLSGECGMLTGESRLYADISAAGRFPFGVGALPYYDDVYGATPRNVLPDGLGLHVLAGFKKADYELAARFIGFLLKPETQRDWVKATGFLPMSPAAIASLRESGAPGVLLEAAERRLSAPKVLRPKNGFGLERLRIILDEEAEAVWRNEKPAKEALDTAMRRAAQK